MRQHIRLTLTTIRLVVRPLCNEISPVQLRERATLFITLPIATESQLASIIIILFSKCSYDTTCSTPVSLQPTESELVTKRTVLRSVFLSLFPSADNCTHTEKVQMNALGSFLEKKSLRKCVCSFYQQEVSSRDLFTQSDGLDMIEVV